MTISPHTPEEVVRRLVVRDDGSVPFVAPQPGVEPTAPEHFATKQYVDDAVGGGGGGGGAPTGAEYLVGAANGTLTSERVVTDTATVTWDLTTGGQAKANVPDASTAAKGAVELATDGESAAGLAVQANDTRLSNARTPTAHSHAQSDVTGLAAALAGKEDAGTAAAAVAAHEAAADPHAGYQKESEKGSANGYASLGSGGLVPMSQLASGTPDGTKFVRDDGVLATPPGGGAGIELFQVKRLAYLRL